MVEAPFSQTPLRSLKSSPPYLQYFCLVRKRTRRQSSGFSACHWRTSERIALITLPLSRAAAPASRMRSMSLVRNAVAIMAFIICVDWTASPSTYVGVIDSDRAAVCGIPGEMSPQDSLTNCPERLKSARGLSSIRPVSGGSIPRSINCRRYRCEHQMRRWMCFLQSAARRSRGIRTVPLCCISRR